MSLVPAFRRDQRFLGERPRTVVRYSWQRTFEALEVNKWLLETRKKAHAFDNCIAFIVSAMPSTRITRLRLYAST
jgi:hypothetical protein